VIERGPAPERASGSLPGVLIMRLLSVFLILCGCLALGGYQPARAQENLAKNGDFERGVPPWRGQKLKDGVLMPAPEMLRATTMGTPPARVHGLHFDSQVAESARHPSDLSGAVCPLSTRLPADSHVRVQFRARALQEDVVLSVAQAGGGGHDRVVVSRDWKRYSLSFQLEGECDELVFSLIGSDPSFPQSMQNGAVFLDDVDVRLVPRTEAPLAHYRADRCGLDAQGVASCVDLSGRHPPARSANAASSPKMGHDGRSSQSILQFDTDTWLGISANKEPLGPTLTMMVIGRCSEFGGVLARLVSEQSPDGQETLLACGGNPAEVLLRAETGAHGAGEYALLSAPARCVANAYTSEAPSLFVAVLVRNETGFSLRVNGGPPRDVKAGPWSSSLAGHFGGVARDANSAPKPPPVEIAEAAIYAGALSPSEIQTLESDALERYGIAACEAAKCGNGIVEHGEACDTGASARCASDCSTDDYVRECSSDGDCGPGQVCPATPNGIGFKRSSLVSVCVPKALCVEASNPACGEKDAVWEQEVWQ
jgi:hypothetical protein